MEDKAVHQLNEACRIAQKYHDGQFRRDNITPYIEHPRRVFELCDTWSSCTVAWLHDILEDTDCPIELLEKNFDQNIVYAVVLLTKDKDVSYEDYIKQIKTHDLARKVKISDIVANLTDKPTEKQIKKYVKALQLLSE